MGSPASTATDFKMSPFSVPLTVVREGKIVEQGSHSELIARPEGAYATLVGLQMSALGAKKAEGQEDVLEDEIVRDHCNTKEAEICQQTF